MSPAARISPISAMRSRADSGACSGGLDIAGIEPFSMLMPSLTDLEQGKFDFV